MVRLLWSAEAVEDKIAALATGHARKKARKAYKHLMHSQQSEYKAFIKESSTPSLFQAALLVQQLYVASFQPNIQSAKPRNWR